jgi:hypothetical protein
MPHPLALANVACLEQGIALLESLTDEQYAKASPLGDRIGGHLRHCLDHYGLLLDACGGPRVDYDARGRDPRVEADRSAAIGLAASLVERLRALDPQTVGSSILVRTDCGDGRRDLAEWTASTVARELQFMVSHTTHHFALVALILRQQGIEPGPDFGVAPSTLLHRRSLVGSKA